MQDYLSTTVAKNHSFRMNYDDDGKFIRIIDPSAIRDTYVMYFICSNRWKSNDQDFYGTFTDFKRWYNKRNYCTRFLRVTSA